jgi:hypothetical protein
VRGRILRRRCDDNNRWGTAVLKRPKEGDILSADLNFSLPLLIADDCVNILLIDFALRAVNCAHRDQRAGSLSILSDTACPPTVSLGIIPGATLFANT